MNTSGRSKQAMGCCLTHQACSLSKSHTGFVLPSTDVSMHIKDGDSPRVGRLANLPPHPVTSAELTGEGGCQYLSMQMDLNRICWDRKRTPGSVYSWDNGMPDTEMRKMHWRGGAHWANNRSFPAVSLKCCDDLSSAGWFATGCLMAE